MRLTLITIIVLPVVLFACSTTPPPQNSKYIIVKFKSSEQVKSLKKTDENILVSEIQPLQHLLEKIGARRWEPLQKGKPRNAELAEKMGMNRIGRLYISETENVQKVMEELNNSGLVEYAEPDQKAKILNSGKEE